MRTLALVLSAVLLTLISTQVSAAVDKTPQSGHVCKIATGYGTAIGRGKTALQAKENARLECGDKMIDQYVAQRRTIPDSVKDDLALACVNLECQ